jgi:hypothetical protein
MNFATRFGLRRMERLRANPLTWIFSPEPWSSTGRGEGSFLRVDTTFRNYESKGAFAFFWELRPAKCLPGICHSREAPSCPDGRGLHVTRRNAPSLSLRPSFPRIRPSPDLDWLQRRYELLDSSHILFYSLRNHAEFPLPTSRRIGKMHLTAADSNC